MPDWFLCFIRFTFFVFVFFDIYSSCIWGILSASAVIFFSFPHSQSSATIVIVTLGADVLILKISGVTNINCFEIISWLKMSEMYQIAKARTIWDNIYTHCDVLVYRKKCLMMCSPTAIEKREVFVEVLSCSTSYNSTTGWDSWRLSQLSKGERSYGQIARTVERQIWE